jgi:hypothetical protein
MKKGLVLLILIIYSFPTFSNLNIVKSSNEVLYGDIKDGWYAATVKYTNYSTYTNSTYSLDVKVEYGRIVKIDFGNGGDVHTGYNNENYYYTGGNLNYETDYNGDITAATATVTITQDGSTKYFKIRIE